MSADDLHSIAVHRWSADKSVKGIVLILHGMAEHALRYAEFANYLASEGFDVFACDHRGHGKTGNLAGKMGFFADKGGWSLITNDILKLAQQIKGDFPKQPLFLFGHSMGSFLARTCMTRSKDLFTGIILCGSSVENVSILRLSLALTKLLIFFQGPYKRTELLNYLTFGAFNKKFYPVRTAFDWLSRDHSEVDAYCQDPLCGFKCTLRFFYDLFTGLIQINDGLVLSCGNKSSVLLISGSCDPVGHMGKDVPLLARKFTESAFPDITYKLYEDARHSLLHESNKLEVFEDILLWLNRKILNYPSSL
ncbi:MAG: alpha/beta hydrolase [Peptococcaceae bacterium]|nr:alpha/beta hydrolase [Peptococcaceae bacterium]